MRKNLQNWADTEISEAAAQFFPFPVVFLLTLTLSYILTLIVPAVAPEPSLLHLSVLNWVQGRTGAVQYPVYIGSSYTVDLKALAEMVKREALLNSIIEL